jgi:alginate O-acetyltransferase complex protein AlgJ
VLLRNLHRRLAVIVFFGLVLGSTALFGVDGPWLGENARFEARTLFPARVSQRMFKEFGGWFGDRIGLRYLLIYAAVEYDVALLRWPIARQAAFGRDGWLFWTDDGDIDRAKLADFRGRFRFRPGEIATINANVKSVSDRLAACGITFLIVVVPNKQSIYGQFLGGDESMVRTRLDDLLERLDPAARADILDLRPALRAAAATEAPRALYPKTDTHWNQLGAFYAYRAIIDALATRSTVPRPKLATRDNYTITQRPFHGDIAMTLLMPSRFPDTDVLLRPGPALPKIETEETSYLNMAFRTADASGEQPLLIFGDSFSPSLAEPLARHYGAAYVRSTNVDGATIAQLKPRVVLLETVARYAHKLLFPAPNMERACAR